MAEIDRGAGTNNTRIIIIAVALAVFFSLFFLIFVRSCGKVGSGPGYKVIYKNLDLKDSANVVLTLKELKIPYELKDEGKTVAVPKEKVDEARLGLAEKNLPLGGAVGWEIFDESKLGATDFDRRVQFVRAISGELSRTIKHIEVVDDARVQIVIPKTELFEVSKAPVTAAVLLQLKPGRTLTKEQINGIVYLVASSVENLRPENVTIVDVFGNILSGGPVIEAAEVQALPPQQQEQVSPEAVVIKASRPALSHEERMAILIQAKQKIEENMNSKVQRLLNQFYPPNTIIVRINLDINPALLSTDELVIDSDAVKRVSVVLLVDNRFELTRSLKKSTFDTIAASIGYVRKRGDIIKLYRVPFHYASTYYGAKEMMPIRPPQKISVFDLFARMVFQKGFFFVVSLLIIAVVILLWFIRPALMRGRKTESGAAQKSEISIIDRVRNVAIEQPERVATILRKWLEEA